jgi:lauroyl/myristoyl acyltransferase
VAFFEQDRHFGQLDHPGPKARLLSVKDILWFVYLFPLRFFARHLSARNLYRLGRALEPCFQVVADSRRRSARERMRRALGERLNDSEFDDISRRFVSNAVWRALDDLHLMDPKSAARLVPPEIHGLDHLTRALAAGNGVVLLTGHFYANRLAKHHLARMGYPVMSVRNGQPPDQWMGRIGARFLQPRYIEFLHSVIGDEVFIQDPQCSLKIFRRLRSGGIVNVHFDSSFSRHSVELPFLGASKRFPTGLLEIVRLSKCSVIPMLCLGNQRAASITFEAPFVFEPAGSREEFASANLGRLVAQLEQQIREHSAEWEIWTRL